MATSVERGREIVMMYKEGKGVPYERRKKEVVVEVGGEGTTEMKAEIERIQGLYRQQRKVLKDKNQENLELRSKLSEEIEKNTILLAKLQAMEED